MHTIRSLTLAEASLVRMNAVIYIIFDSLTVFSLITDATDDNTKFRRINRAKNQ